MQTVVSKKLEGYFFSVTLIGALLLVGYLFLPYVGALAIALVIAVLMYPVYEHIKRIVRFETLAALLTVLLACIVLLVPATFVVYLIAHEVRGAAELLMAPGHAGLFDMLMPLEATLNSWLPASIDVNVRSLAVEALNMLSRNLGGAFASTASVLLKLFVSLIALYYFLKDGQWFKRLLVEYSPLSDMDDHAVLHKLDLVMHSLIRGGLVIALLQGLLTGIGFYLFGLPNPVLWGSIAAVTAILPTIGTALVTVPAFIWLLLSGPILSALLFATYGLMIIGLVDNILGPRIIGHGKGVEIHPLLVLLAVLGGLGVFGAAGFLIGPMILAFLIALMHIYRQKTILEE